MVYEASVVNYIDELVFICMFKHTLTGLNRSTNLTKENIIIL